MARKSRKAMNWASDTAPKEKPKPEKIRVGIYTRLSVKNLGREDNESIETQIAILQEFVISHPEMELTEIYADNGWTGTNFQRPDFTRMLNDIENRRLDCVIVKDLSRLGRNYLSLAYYLQTYFPANHIRFIALNDSFDSFVNDSDDLVIILKSIMNEYYAKDISKKLSSTIDMRRKAGPYFFGGIPYGYLRGDSTKEPWRIDPNAEPVVRLIFDWAKQAVPASSIAERLTAMKIPTPNQPNQNGELLRPWNPSVVQAIIENPTYTGDFYYRKQLHRKHDIHNSQDFSSDDWLVHRDTHPAYVSREEYKNMRAARSHLKRKSSRIRSDSNPRSNSFKGLLFCSICGKPLRLRQYAGSGRYYCPGNQTTATAAHNPVLIDMDLLRVVVCASLQFQINAALQMDSFFNRPALLSARQSLKASRFSEFKSKSTKLTSVCQKRRLLMEMMANGTLEVDDFRVQLSALKQKEEELTAETEAARQRLAEVDQIFIGEQEWLRTVMQEKLSDKIDTELLKLLIGRIVLFPDASIDVQYNFSNWLLPCTNPTEATHE